jgi:hypothetical protein
VIGGAVVCRHGDFPDPGNFPRFRVQVLGHSNSPYPPVSGHAGTSPGRWRPPAPGDRRCFLLNFSFRFGALRPGLACCQGEGLRGPEGSCSQGADGRVVGEGHLALAQVPDHILRTGLVPDVDTAASSPSPLSSAGLGAHQVQGG